MTADLVSDEQLAEWEALTEAATPGPWEHGDRYNLAGVLRERFGDNRCGHCGTSKPVWVGVTDINGHQMVAHVHETDGPWWPHGIVAALSGDRLPCQVVTETDEYGLMSGPDAEFIAAARTAVPLLVRALRDARDERDALLQTPPTVEALVRREFVESELYRTRSQALRERDEARDEAEVERDSLRAENAALEREVDSLHAGREIAEHFDGDDWLRDQHARYHGQDGNMLGREECEWERCEFWDAADWTMRAFGPPVRAERDALREVAEWLVSMDTAEFWGRSERATVTLNDIIIRARSALAAPTGQEQDNG